MIVYGIDPGLSGAIARFDLTEGFLEIHDMPIMEVNKKKSVSPQLVADILRQQHAPVYIEKVGAMPGQGVSSMFSFGRSYGVLLGCAAGLQMPTTVITPVEWQRALKCQKGKKAKTATGNEPVNYSPHTASCSPEKRTTAERMLLYLPIILVL